MREYPQQVVPYCVSTVPDVTLFEAELRGLEGLAPGKVGEGRLAP